MTLLFDQILSPRLVEASRPDIPQSWHVTGLGLDRADDLEVWRAARDRGWIIVTKDRDFQDLASLHGVPPWVVWIRRGNCSTGEIEQLLRRDVDAVRSLSVSTERGVLILH